MASLIWIFRDMPGPRTGNTQSHHPLDVLTIALVASVCRAEGCVDFAEFAEVRERFLSEFLALDHGLPSHDTSSRVFLLLDPEAFGRAIEMFLVDLGANGAGVLAIDGKTKTMSHEETEAKMNKQKPKCRNRSQKRKSTRLTVGTDNLVREKSSVRSP
jgi:DDE_Tnp_1-associated